MYNILILRSLCQIVAVNTCRLKQFKISILNVSISNKTSKYEIDFKIKSKTPIS